MPMNREFCYLLCDEWFRYSSTGPGGDRFLPSRTEPRLSRSTNVGSRKILFIRDTVPTPAILALVTPSSSASPSSKGGYDSMSVYKPCETSMGKRLSPDLLR